MGGGGGGGGGRFSDLSKNEAHFSSHLFVLELKQIHLIKWILKTRLNSEGRKSQNSFSMRNRKKINDNRVNANKLCLALLPLGAHAGGDRVCPQTV